MSYPSCRERDFWRDFIELYRGLPCLWDIKSQEYTDRHMKALAYEVLVAKLRERTPNADREAAVRKINALRSSFRKEARKVQASMKSVAKSGGSVYKPHLWYYELLSFLRYHGSPVTSNAKTQEFDEPDEEATAQLLCSTVDEFNESGDVDPSTGVSDGSRTPSTNPASPIDLNLLDNPNPLDNAEPLDYQAPPIKQTKYDEMNRRSGSVGDEKRFDNYKSPERAQRRRTVVQDGSSSSMDYLTSRINHSVSNAIEDEFDTVGKIVATKLRKIPNRTRIIAEKLISDVLFYAEIGELTLSTKITADSIPWDRPTAASLNPSARSDSRIWHRPSSTISSTEANCEEVKPNIDQFEY